MKLTSLPAVATPLRSALPFGRDRKALSLPKLGVHLISRAVRQSATQGWHPARPQLSGHPLGSTGTDRLDCRRIIDQSLASIPEDSLVQHLLSDRHWRSRLLGIRGIPDDVLTIQLVLLVGAPGGFEGDVDILLCAKNQPKRYNQKVCK